jgi:hypothetical protein
MTERGMRTLIIVLFEVAVVLGASSVFLRPRTLPLTTQLIITVGVIAVAQVFLFITLTRRRQSPPTNIVKRKPSALQWFYILTFVYALLWMIWQLIHHRLH